MCELFGLSSRFPTTVRLSLDELARHGGGTGPHRDGWGVAFADQGDAMILREPEAAHESRLLACAQQHVMRSNAVVAHVRKATQGRRLLRNTQPFARELGGKVHVFAHNGMLPGVEEDARFATRRFRRVGDTDSEHAFCALLERVAPLWESGVPPLVRRLAVLARFAGDARALGPANFLYFDGDVLFAHGHRRNDGAGLVRPPGLHVLCRTCRADKDGVALAGVAVGAEEAQEVALVASVPLSAERWEPLAEGEIVALKDGRVVGRTSP